MNQIGIFFGTDTGTTRLIAKKMAKKIGDIASKPLNVNRTEVDKFLSYDAYILGTPSYGQGDLPGNSTGVKSGSWEEFLPLIQDADMTGKTIALYGLGNQEKYPDRFASSVFQLYSFFTRRGAEIIGGWPIEGYDFESSSAIVDDEFVGLVIDQHNQALLTEERIDTWLQRVVPSLIANLEKPAVVNE